ncbi:UvrD-helicase domain-containing protein [Mycolicibacterium sp.]|uniref:UvrD-helicase domain-containing protein n=1 Tax=Mycolicibacterium sp. TaxID=2320850 RepID=UPI0037C5C5CC
MGDMTPTAEQAAIVDAAARGKDLVIQAGAGTGKTSTLRLLASATPARKALYVAYNRTIADEAAGSFPDHVQCRTAHSLAYGAIGRRYAHRLNGPRQLPARRAEILGTGWLDLRPHLSVSPAQLARIAVDTVTRYCYSADDEINESHVPFQTGIIGADHAALAARVLPYAQRAWSDINDRDGLLKFEHDHYVKMWALTRPTLPADVVMLDEAQDTNAVVAQVVQAQTHAQRIAVGDSCQQLYAWRGASDALDTWEADECLYLSQSWRFGSAIAQEANRWLTHIDTPLRLSGNPAIRSELASVDRPRAILCRTNAESVTQVMALLAAGRRVALAGGGTEIRRLAEAVDDLKNGRRTSHPELYVFETWGALQEYVDTDRSGQDLKPFVDLIDSHGAETILAAVDSLVDEKRCDTVVSTAHKAKGREWDSVLIADDFTEPLDDDGIPRTSAMLAYVAVTRARHQLDRGSLAWIDRYSRRGGGRGTVQRRQPHRDVGGTARTGSGPGRLAGVGDGQR